MRMFTSERKHEYFRMWIGLQRIVTLIDPLSTERPCAFGSHRIHILTDQEKKNLGIVDSEVLLKAKRSTVQGLAQSTMN